MKSIAAPIDAHSSRDSIQNLQAALLRIHEWRPLQGLEAPQLERLRAERDAGKFDEASRVTVQIYQARNHLERVGFVDAPTADALNRDLRDAGALNGESEEESEFVVTGYVVDSASIPVQGVRVTVFDRDLGETRDTLGSDPTDESGRFTVHYQRADYARGDLGTADLLFEVVRAQDGAEARQSLIAIQRLRTEGEDHAPRPDWIRDDDLLLGIPARRVEEVILVLDARALPRGLSEFEIIQQAMQPLLERLPNRSPAELDEEKFRDVSFAAREIDVDRDLVALFVDTHRMARGNFANIPPVAFYGIGRASGTLATAALSNRAAAELAADLERASADPPNWIPAFESAEALRRVAQSIHDIATQEALSHAPTASEPSLRRVFSALQVSDAEQAVALDVYAQNRESPSQFWSALSTREGFQDPARIGKLQLGIQLELLSGGRNGFVTAAQNVGTLRDVAIAPQMLHAMTQQIPEDQLTDIDGTSVEEKRASLAKRMEATLQAAFPTETVALSLRNGPAPEALRSTRDAAATFLLKASAPGSAAGDAFDIRKTHVKQFVARNTALLDGVAEAARPALVAEVQRAQRLFNLSASPSSFQALSGTSFMSAQDIARLPKSTFIKANQSILGGVDVAGLVHARATNVAMDATALVINAMQARSDVQPAALGPPLKTPPTWAAMFDGAEACECLHCQSIYGKAAHFVSLLEFLRHPPEKTEAGYTPLDHLIGNVDGPIDPPGTNSQRAPRGRRPDLAHIALDCENSDTPLPYVDITNEVLESYVVDGELSAATAHDVDGRTSAELLANPQYVNEKAYDALKGALYPTLLPFDRPLEAARRYLERLGTSRREVMSTLAGDGEAQWSAAAVAEALGVSAREYEILCGKRFDGSDAGIDVKALYGYEETVPPSSLGEQMRPVRRFLERTGLSYVELVAFLKTDFANPSLAAFFDVDALALTADELNTLESSDFADVPDSVNDKLDAAGVTLDSLKAWLKALSSFVVLKAEGDECDLDRTVIQQRDGKALADDALLALHRSVRLARRLSLPFDRLAVLLSTRDFKADPVEALRAVAQTRAVAAELNTPLQEALLLWSNLDTQGERSTYSRLFENHALPRTSQASFTLIAARTELAAAAKGAPEKIEAHVSTIAAALRIRDTELATIRDDAKLGADAALNLANLSKLYRYPLLARALGMPLSLVLEMRRLLKPEGDPLASPAAALKFLHHRKRLQGIDIKAAELAYWCRHRDEGGKFGAVVEAQAKTLNTLVHETLARSSEEVKALLRSPDAEQLRAKLALLLGAADADRFSSVVEGTSELWNAGREVDRENFLRAETRLDPILDADARVDTLSTQLPADPGARETQLVARRKALLEPLVPLIQRDALAQVVSAVLGIADAALAECLLEDSALLHGITDASKPMLSQFTADEAALSADRHKAVIRLYKAFALISRFGLTADELKSIAARPAQIGGFDLNLLPVAASDGDAAFGLISVAATWADVRARLPAGGEHLLEVLNAASDAERDTRLAVGLGVERGAIAEARAALGLSSAEYQSLKGLRKLIGAWELSTRTGVSLDKLASWGGEATASVADGVAKALRARLDDDTWLAASKEINDKMRLMQRDALVAYVLTMPAIRQLRLATPDQLYQHFLIDVQMDCCMVTSRLVQAISTVQLYIQRCLLDLDPEIRPSMIDAKRYETVKNTRVLEAAKRVFVDTENYIEAELRDDKSPAFRKIESDLLQSNLSDEVATQACMSYVAELVKMERLETCGLFYQEAANPAENVLHVISRTRNSAPREYFYRRWVGNSKWTPWETVDLEFDAREDASGAGVQVLPYVWRDRLYLFWTTMSAKQDEAKSQKIEDGGSTPKKPPAYWEVKLAWSTYEQGRWSPKKLSNAVWEYPGGRGEPNMFLSSAVGSIGKDKAKKDFIVTTPVGTISKAFSDTASSIGISADFRLHALDTAGGLRVLVINRHETSIGVFELEHPQDEFWSNHDAWYPQSQISVRNTTRSFMQQAGVGQLSLAIPHASDQLPQELLGNLGRFRATLAAQTADVSRSMTHPFFVENMGAVYFVETRPTVEMVAKKVGPSAVTSPPSFEYLKPKNTAFSIAALTGGMDGSTLSPKAEIAKPSSLVQMTANTAGPWTAAAASIAPARSKDISLQSGVSQGSGTILTAVAKDTFLQYGSISSQWIISPIPAVQARIQTAFHPYASEFMRRLKSGGVAGLYSLDTQSLGNPYLRAPWNPGQRVSGPANGAASLIEGTVGRNAQTGRPGNFEAAVREGDDLVHIWHDSSNVVLPWNKALTITTAVTSAPCLIERASDRVTNAQGVVTQRGTFELVVRRAGGLEHFSWPANMPPQWTAMGVASANAVEAGALIESDYLTGGKRSLDLLVPESTADARRTRLAHYRRDNADNVWKLQGVVAERTTGAATLIQSSFKTNGHGRLEALVLEPNPSSVTSHWLVHYWKNDSDTKWVRGSLVSDVAVGPGSLIQSTIQDVRDHGNLEALVYEEGQAVHYWRDSSAAIPVWHRGQILSASATGAGCLIQGHYGSIGNFEALVPEGPNLQHYWHANEGPVSSPSERFYFLRQHAPTERVTGGLPRHDVDFNYSSPYGLYNKELFIDLPDLLSSQFLRMKRYPECLKWIRHVCDFSIDTKERGAQRVWRALPFRDDDRTSLEKMFLSLHSERPEDAGLADHTRNVIREWKSNPFMPHAIARMRPSVYKKHFVMKYLDCLLDWSRDLHAQAYAIGSIERLNEAIQICVMASDALGPRPEVVPRRTKLVRRTYDQLRRSGIDEFGNAVVELENELPFSSDSPPTEYSGDVGVLLGMVRSLYFCIPRNEKLLGYWDRVEDQLYKMRHCMDPEGVVRQLPLSEPEIDPMMLVKAAATGISLSTALSALGAPLPPYRFQFTLQKALELANEVKQLGAHVLSFIERKDAEGLARLRASQETKMQRLVRTVREQQLEAAKVLKQQLMTSRDSALARWTHFQTMLGENNKAPALPDVKSSVDERGTYRITAKTGSAARYQPSGRFQLVDLQSVTMGLSLTAVGGAVGGAVAGPAGAAAGAVGAGSVNAEFSSSFDQGTKILSYEKEELVNAFQSTVTAGAAGALEALGSVLNIYPTFSLDAKPLGVGGSVSFGGQNLGSAAAAAGRALQVLASTYSYSSGKAARQAQFVLRERDWAQLNNVAAADIEAIDQQIVHAQVQADVAEREIFNIDRQIEELVGNEEFLDTKFTKKERYAILEAQAVTDFSACYRAALSAANTCLRCYEFERGAANSSLLSATGYWDDANKGLLAGERLSLALRQMEQEYLSRNVREFEITKHVSLLALDPLEFIALKEKGIARFKIPEALFDLDYPGHYMRRIKSLSVTIPCMTGPHTCVAATLRLVKSQVRCKPDDPDNYNYKGEGDGRFMTNYASCRAIATSSGQRDFGLFEHNLRDERYLPFEGEGVDCEVEVEFGHELSPIDVQASTDMVLTFLYTSRAGGERLKKGALDALKKAFHRDEPNLPVQRLFSLRHEFPNQWHELTRSVPEDQQGEITRTVDLPIVKERLPYMLMGRPSIKAIQASVLAVPKPSAALGNFKLQLTAGEAAPIVFDLKAAPERFGRSLFTAQQMNDAIASEITAKPWRVEIKMQAAALRALSATMGDLLMVLAIEA